MWVAKCCTFIKCNHMATLRGTFLIFYTKLWPDATCISRHRLYIKSKCISKFSWSCKMLSNQGFTLYIYKYIYGLNNKKRTLHVCPTLEEWVDVWWKILMVGILYTFSGRGFFHLCVIFNCYFAECQQAAALICVLWQQQDAALRIHTSVPAALYFSNHR